MHTFVKAKGADLFCSIMGKGDPLIVVHGGAGFITHEYLLPHMERLAQNNQLIFYDQRALGKSTGEITPEEITLSTYLQDIEAIRTSLGLEKISLLGHSWGAFLAFHYACVYPEAVDKLVLLSPMPGKSDDLPLFFSELAKRLTPYQEELQKIEASELYRAGDPELVKKWLTIVYQIYMHSPDNVHKLNLWKSQQEALRGFKVWDIFKEAIFMNPYDVTDSLRALRCPTMIIHGDVDPIPLASVEYLHTVIPSSTLVKIEQSGHFPFVEQPDACFKAIEGFLRIL
ncbi:MAG: alpha/beta fold hydrolase [Verrucomicrobia bacterium]|nr:alpha/beta fold hydrolase [Verrucomicrobiota bacterium]